MDTDIKLLMAQAKIELARLEAEAPAKDVAGKAIGKHGLAYITAIVVIGVIASIFLDENKMAAVMGLLGASFGGGGVVLAGDAAYAGAAYAETAFG